jgi:lysophospholipase L1-like esterase
VIRRRLRLFSYAACGLAVVTALAFAQFVVPPRPTAPSLPAPAASVQAQAGAEPVRILPMGASITYGYEYGSYRAPLWDLLTADGHAIDFVGSQSDGPSDLPDREHEGHRGWRIAQIEERAAAWVEEHGPDIVLLHVGTNDLIQGATVQEAAGDMDTLLDTLTSAAPDMTVIVSTLIPLHGGDSNWRQTNAAFADLVTRRAAAGDRVMLADMADGGPGPGDEIPDGVHPNGAGYAAMAQVWHPVVVEALARYVPDASEETPASEGTSQAGPADPQALTPLQISENGRFLQHSDGRPFFWLADTGWEMFHRASREDAELYLDTRAEQGFTVIQSVALAEKGGLDVPTPAGHTPLRNNDPATPDVQDGPDNDYWDDVDYMIDYANGKGLYVALWAAWGSMVHDGPEVLDESNARAYGEFLGERYADKGVIFVLGGDRQSNTGGNTPEVWSAVAEGIRSADTGRHLISFHPWGEESSTEMFPNDSPVIDFNLIQGSHKKVSFDELTTLIVEDYGKTPVKPVIDSEVFYEEHPFNWDSSVGWKTAVHARGAAYYQVFSGAAGHTYGDGAVHQFWEPGMDAPYEVRDPWQEAIRHEGATQMQHLKSLMLSRSYFDRVPDQSLVTSGTGRATRSASGSWAMVYLPDGGTVGVDTSRLAGAAPEVTWFNPRTGESQAHSQAGGDDSFTAPDEQDWVLILDAVQR